MLLAANVGKRDLFGVVRLLAARLVSNRRVVVQSLVGPQTVIESQIRFAEVVQVLGAEDAKVIEQLVPEGLDHPFDVGLHVRCAVGNLHGLGLFALERLVERLG